MGHTGDQRDYSAAVVDKEEKEVSRLTLQAV